MDTVSEIGELRKWVGAYKGQGKRIGFVPTMGFLHEGHLSLVRLAKQKADRVVVSVFVNPAQFNDPKDFANYPMDVARDAAMLKSAGADLLFTPSTEVMYGRPGNASQSLKFQSWVTVDELSQPLEGAFRPGHFRGVTTVVSMLFNAVQPDCAVFGEKDFQQLRVIEQMVTDLKFPVEIVRAPLVREPDGLAMSSRNVRLSGEGRSAARLLSRALGEAIDLYRNGQRSTRRLCNEALRVLSESPLVTPEYVTIVDEESLLEVEEAGQRTRMLIAAVVDGVRLIDNRAMS